MLPQQPQQTASDRPLCVLSGLSASLRWRFSAPKSCAKSQPLSRALGLEGDARSQTTKTSNPACRSLNFTLSCDKFVLLFKTLRGGGVKKINAFPIFHNNMVCNGLLHLCRMRLCSPNTDVRHDSAPLWNDRLWKRGEAGDKSRRAASERRTRLSLTHMVKCWGICFSLCCALCSPPRRTRGGSNTAATVKKGDNPRQIRKNPQR